VTNECVAIVAESKLFRAGIKSLIGSQLLVAMEADCAVETSRWHAAPNLILVDAVEGNEASVFVDLDARFPRSPVVFPTFTQNPTALARTRGVGRLSREQAVEWAVVGPVARASGLDIDVRKDQPYLSYADLGFEIVVRPEGDVLARVVVRALEMMESVRLIREALLSLPPGPLRATQGLPEIPAGEATIRTEAPRGEAFYYVASEGGASPARVKIRTPSFVNIPAIEPMVMGQPLADLSIIQASVDPCISCTDR